MTDILQPHIERDPIPKAKQEIIDQKVKELTFLGTQRPHRGHKLFELDLKKMVITEMVIEKRVIYDAKTRKGVKKGKVTTRPDCWYTFALNTKNAKKKFDNMWKARMLQKLVEKA